MVVTAPGEAITSSSGSKLHSHKVSYLCTPSFIYLYTYLCIYLGRREAHMHHVVVKKQSVGIDSLLPLCEFWGLNSGHLQA